ncbi:MAG: hypothetical protein ABSF52_01590 [Syntrophobacteraceae bacterium]
MAEIETTAGNMSILRNLMGTPLLESHLDSVAGGYGRPSIVPIQFLVSVLEREANIAQPKIFTTAGWRFGRADETTIRFLLELFPANEKPRFSI